MLIRFNCSNCGTRVKVPAEVAGQKVKCPRCGSVQLVPVDSPPAEPSVPAAPRAQAPAAVEEGMFEAGGGDDDPLAALAAAAGSEGPDDEQIDVRAVTAPPPRPVSKPVSRPQPTGQAASAAPAKPKHAPAPAPGASAPPPTFKPKPPQPLAVTPPPPEPPEAPAPPSTPEAPEFPETTPPTADDDDLAALASIAGVAQEQEELPFEPEPAAVAPPPVAPPVPTLAGRPQPQPQPDGARPSAAASPRTIAISSHPAIARPGAKPIPLVDQPVSAAPAPPYSMLIYLAWTLRLLAALAVPASVRLMLMVKEVQSRSSDSSGLDQYLALFAGLLAAVMAWTLAEIALAARAAARR